MNFPVCASNTIVEFISGDFIDTSHCILFNNSFQNPDFCERFTPIFSSGIPSSPLNITVPHSSSLGFNKYFSAWKRAASELSTGDLHFNDFYFDS